METTTIMSVQENINDLKKFHSFIGESLENSDIEHLFASSDTVFHPMTFISTVTC